MVRARHHSTTKRLATAGMLALVACCGLLLDSDFLSEGTRRLSEAGAFVRDAAAPKVRRNSISLPGGKCRVTPAVTPGGPIAPTFAASYPGSGSKMTWNLIEALTGLVTGDEHRLSGRRWTRTITIKTHFPHYEGNPYVEEAAKESIPRAILLIRHPKDAIPSYHSYIYEFENSLPGHSTRAPLEEWIKWRDVHYEKELDTWRRHTEYWMDRYDGPGERLILPYEQLTDELGGQIYAEKLAEFLNATDFVNVAPQESVPCIWRKVVKYHLKRFSSEQQQRRQKEEEKEVKEERVPPPLPPSDPSMPQSRRFGSTFHPYTRDQLEMMFDTIKGLQEKFRHNEELNKILHSYVKIIRGETTYEYDDPLHVSYINSS